MEFGIRDQIVEHVRKYYPDAEIVMGFEESQQHGGPREGHYLKGWQGGMVVLRKLPNGFADVFTIDLCREYESIVIALHCHYKDVFQRAPACKNDEEYDFSTNANPKYWQRKLNKTALMKECDKRGIVIDNPMMTLNVKIIEVLIAADTT
jgi:hypothetical protein